MSALHVVTGALGYTGKSLARMLLAQGDRVRTLTNSPGRPNPFGDQLEIAPLAFADPGGLARSLEGADTLYNTYWVRFDHRLFSFAQAVRDTRVLFDAARRAGVRRVVHVSILHAEQADDLGYYRGKHELERALGSTGLSYAIVRPGVLFGRGDILVNNICWVLRHFPVFGLFGDGGYRLRPLHVDDMARLMMECAERPESITLDAVGPETFTYRNLVRTISRLCGLRRPIVHVPPAWGYLVGRCLQPILKDVVITREEITGLMRGLLDSEASSTAPTRLSDWVGEHADTLGRRYASEVARRVQRAAAYEDL